MNILTGDEASAGSIQLSTGGIGQGGSLNLQSTNVASSSETIRISASGSDVQNGIRLDTGSATTDGSGSIAVVAGSSNAAAGVSIRSNSGSSGSGERSAGPLATSASGIVLDADSASIDMASAKVSAQTTSVQLTATTNEADITLNSANKLTARVGSVGGASGTAVNPPRLELAADAGTVHVSGSSYVGESQSIKLTSSSTDAEEGIVLESVQQSIKLSVGQSGNGVESGNIELATGGTSSVIGGDVNILTGDEASAGSIQLSTGGIGQGGRIKDGRGTNMEQLLVL